MRGYGIQNTSTRYLWSFFIKCKFYIKIFPMRNNFCHLLVACTKFRSRSGRKNLWSDLIQTVYTLITFLKEVFGKFDFEKNQQTTEKNMQYYPACRVKKTLLFSSFSGWCLTSYVYKSSRDCEDKTPGRWGDCW